MLYLYARVSTDRQENGREAQTSRLLSHAKGAEYTLEVDEDVSAYNVRLHARPAGKKMYDALKAGDTVVITKIDRAFRRMYDFAITREQWERLGVSLVVLDLPENLAGPHGRFFLSVVVAAGELESEMHGQRKREVYAYKRAAGLPYNALRPFGWLAVKNKQGRLADWTPCPEERELGERVLTMQEAGNTLSQIAIALVHDGARKPRVKKGSSGYYHVQDILLLARAAKAGYPRLARDFWQAPDYALKLTAMKSRGHPL